MSSKLIEAEHKYNELLPVKRVEQRLPHGLLAAGIAWSEEVWAQAEQLGAMPLPVKQMAAANELAGHPVFICGVHRSGTTLVRDLLDGHPELLVLPSEGTYFTTLERKLNVLAENERVAFLGKEWLRRLANPINQSPYWLLGRSGDTRSPYVDFARYLLAWWKNLNRDNPQWPHTAIILAYAYSIHQTGAGLWVDKTPANERYLERIWREMPSAKIVHIIRDPVATIASRRKMEHSVNMRSALSDLKVSFNVAVKQSSLNDPRYVCIRYEKLCENPKEFAQKIASFLGIAISDTLLSPTVAGIPSHANSSFTKEAASGQILKREQHSGSEILTGNEQQLIAAYIGELARELGYSLAKISFLHRWFLRIKYRLWK